MTAAVAALVAFAAGLETRFDSARAAPLFRAAAGGFDSAWADAANRTPGLAVNRGRAHFLAGDLPAAVRAYRDGLEIAPTDRAVRTGLETLRDRVIYPDPAWRPAAPDGLRDRVAARDWFGLAAVGAAAFAVGVGRRWWPGAVTGSGLFLVSLLGQFSHAADPVAVVAARTVLRTGNAASFPAAAALPLPAGLEVTPCGERGGWVRVELANGVTGWVPAPSLLKANVRREPDV